VAGEEKAKESTWEKGFQSFEEKKKEMWRIQGPGNFTGNKHDSWCWKTKQNKTKKTNLAYLTDQEDILQNTLELDNFHTDNINTETSVSILLLINHISMIH
jgi:hypothetical protein